MRKTVFHFFLLVVTALIAANSSQAESPQYLHDASGLTTDVRPEPTLSTLAWGRQSDNQIALTGFDECVASGDEDICHEGNDCGDCVGNWRDNTEVWFGADAYKSLGDSALTGFNPLPFALGNSFGAVAGFNSGLGLGDSRVRAQLGASYGAYDWKGRTTILPAQDNSLEQQTYVTFGFFKRSDVCCGDRISWGVVYDQFFGHQWGWAANEVYLSQLRGIVGYALNDVNEVGVWGTFNTNQDTVSLGFPVGAVSTDIRAVNQLNAYLRHHWAFGGNSMLYAGAVGAADVGSWQFGMLNTVPVSRAASVYANCTYVAPGSATGLVGVSEEQWNASVGLVFYLGRKAVSDSVSGNQGLPLLPVANNGSFLITN